MSDEPLRPDGALVVASVRPKAFELSGLACVGDDALLARRGWNAAFWSVGDERNIDDAIVLIGHRSGAQPADGWELEHFEDDRWLYTGPAASDSEAIARHGGFVYVIGSHFGSARRGLQSKRAFVARFAEGRAPSSDQPAADLEVVHDEFRLHRAINDALHPWTPKPSDLASLRLSDEARRRFISRTMQGSDPSLAKRISQDDWPINIEGLAFRANGTALLGLRFPVDAQGHPFIVEVERFADVMFGDAPLTVAAVWVLHDVGSRDRPAGIRDLDGDPDSTTPGDTVSLVVGGSGGEFAVEGAGSASSGPGDGQRFEHWQTTLPDRGDGDGGLQDATRVRRLDKQGHVEGLTRWSGVGFAYLADSKKNPAMWLDRTGPFDSAKQR